MAVKQGGYQMGRAYSWYRSQGHNVVSASFMLLPSEVIFWALIVEALVLAVLWGGR